MKSEKLQLKIKNFILLFLILIFSFSIVFPAQAVEYLPIVQCGLKSQDNPNTPIVEGGCTTCDFFKMVKNLIDLTLYVLTPILATFFFIWAGFQMLLAGANPGLFGGAKKLFTNTIIGVIIVLCSWLIVNTFMTTFGPDNIPGFDKTNWYSFKCPAGLP